MQSSQKDLTNRWAAYEIRHRSFIDFARILLNRRIFMPYKIFASLVICGSILLGGCHSGNSVTRIGQTENTNSATKAVAQTTPADGARRITAIELNDLMKKNEVFIVDVRNEASYDAGHLPGAKLIPASEILNHVDELPKNKLIVTYCS